MSSKLYIGTMSGTSVDGLDIVIAEINEHKVSLIHTYFHAYPDKLSQTIRQLQTIESETLFKQYSTKLDLLDTELALFFSHHINTCLDQANITAERITAIGNHGQTITHQPNAEPGFSLQLCNAQLLANQCSIPVVANFRQADIDQQGQGAPLIPAFHATIFNDHKPCAIVNIGGISNTTLLQNSTVIGFDNGPGNTLMDAWIYKHKRQRFDENGEWGRSGKVHIDLLNTLLSNPFFKLTAPKSTGQDTYNLEWLEKNLAIFDHIPTNDVQATLCELTAICIANDIINYGESIKNVYICGGGAKNSFLMKRLQFLLKNKATVNTTDALGVDPDWVEALGFAWLAQRHKHKLTGNLPSVTGAKKAVILGQRFNPAI